MFNDTESLIRLGIAILIAYSAILWLGILVWAYRDIRDRTHDVASHVMAVVFVALFNMPGIVLYLILRPHETLTETYERRLESEALIRDLAEARHTCPSCQHAVKEDYLFCQNCRTQLHKPCAECGKPLGLDWRACPFCGAHGPQPLVSTSAIPPEMAASPPPAPEEDETSASKATAPTSGAGTHS